MPVLKNARHEKFAQNVAKGKSATEAYKLAYGAKAKSAEAAGSRLLGNVKVRKRVEELKAAGAARAEVSIEKVLRELSLIGFANMRDYIRIGDDGDPYFDMSELDRDQAAVISELVVEDFKDGRGEDARDVRRIKFKLHDKRAALVDLGKHLGMFRDKIDLNLSGGMRLEKIERAIVDPKN